MIRITIALLLSISPLGAQVLQISGGSSTLYNGSGGGITLYTPSSTLYGGLGFTHGHLVYGASDTFKLRGYDVTVGDAPFGFSFSGAGLGITTRGLAVRRNGKRQTFSAFLGTSALGYSTPFVTTARSQHVGAGFFYQLHDGHWTASNLEVIDGGVHTSINGLAYERPHVKLDAAGGLLSNTGFFSAAATVRASAVSFTANHENLLWGAEVGKVDSAGAYASLGRVNLSTAVFRSSFQRRVSGISSTVGIRLGPVTGGTSWYRNGGTQFFNHYLTERVGQHLNFTQNFSQSSRNAWSFGGGYVSNSFSIQFGHSILFLVDRGFQQVLSVQVSFRIHDTSISGGTVTDPFGRVRWSAYGSDYVQTGLQLGDNGGGSIHGTAITGTVKDAFGNPVAGIAVHLGKQMVFSNDQGQFLARFKGKATVTVSVDLDQTVTPGSWTIVSCPAAAKPGDEINLTVARPTS